MNFAYKKGFWNCKILPPIVFRFWLKIYKFWQVEGYETINFSSFHIKSMQDQRISNLTYFTHLNLQIFLPLMFYHFEMKTYLFNTYLYLKVFWSVFWEYAHDNVGIHYSLNTFRYSLKGNSLSKSSLISWYEKKGQAAKR